jgi:hypothetical protein
MQQRERERYIRVKQNISRAKDRMVHKFYLMIAAAILFSELMYEGVFISFRTGRLGQELQMVQLSATKCNCIAILWVSIVSFAAIILCVASQQVFIVVVVDFVMDSVPKLLDTPSYNPRLRRIRCRCSPPLSQCPIVLWWPLFGRAGSRV